MLWAMAQPGIKLRGEMTYEANKAKYGGMMKRRHVKRTVV